MKINLNYSYHQSLLILLVQKLMKIHLFCKYQTLKAKRMNFDNHSEEKELQKMHKSVQY